MSFKSINYKLKAEKNAFENGRISNADQIRFVVNKMQKRIM